MTSNIEFIQPCPFCGNSESIDIMANLKKTKIQMQCSVCESTGPSQLVTGMGEKAYESAINRAAAAWNRRVRGRARKNKDEKGQNE